MILNEALKTVRNGAKYLHSTKSMTDKSLEKTITLYTCLAAIPLAYKLAKDGINTLTACIKK